MYGKMFLNIRGNQFTGDAVCKSFHPSPHLGMKILSRCRDREGEREREREREREMDGCMNRSRLSKEVENKRPNCLDGGEKSPSFLMRYSAKYCAPLRTK